MDEMISRQAVLKLLSAMPPEEAITKAMLIQSVQQMDAAQPKSYREGYQAGFKDAQLEQPWIPCSERLPEDYEDVLVWYEYFRYGGYNRIAQTWDVGYYISEFNRWGGGVTGQKVRAIAWMPLPEPYKEDDHETD